MIGWCVVSNQSSYCGSLSLTQFSLFEWNTGKNKLLAIRSDVYAKRCEISTNSFFDNTLIASFVACLFKQRFTHVSHEPSWAAGWLLGHSILSVVCGRGETGSWSSPQLPSLDSPPALSQCPQLTDPWVHQLQNPRPITHRQTKHLVQMGKKKNIYLYICQSVLLALAEEKF